MPTTVVNGKSYFTEGPWQDDEPGKPAVVVWRGYELVRQPHVRYGLQLPWSNYAEEARWFFSVDGGRATIGILDDEGESAVSFQHVAESDHLALDGAAAKAESWLRRMQVLLQWRS